ncbi:MAG TPA: trehalose-phosphatase, partial [Actinomycetota bacterium]|nr:trehalose-phosphatase [Actinomycetota bacterium]
MDVETAAEELARRAPEAGIFLDLDGTLAPIVARPELARVIPEATRALERLVGRVAAVAVVSGRPSD